MARVFFGTAAAAEPSPGSQLKIEISRQKKGLQFDVTVVRVGVVPLSIRDFSVKPIYSSRINNVLKTCVAS